MDQGKLRYRIVGSVVLLALLAILVPVLNDVRQPMPQGPQAIDIPAEPTDGLTARVPMGGATPDDWAPQPQDVPEPLPGPPLTEEERAPAIAGAVPVEPSSPPGMPVRTQDPEPEKTAPTVAPAPLPRRSTAPTATQPAVKPMPATPAPAAAKPVPPPRPPQAAPATQQAWVVQLGVYGNIKTAIDLRERLRKAGHSAFTEEVATPHGKALRVRVGPVLDRAAAQALRERLERETGDKGIVMAYP